MKEQYPNPALGILVDEATFKRIIETRDFNLLPPGSGGSSPCGSDRYPVTLARVINENTIAVRSCEDKVVSGNEETGDARYEFTDKPGGSEQIYTRRKPTPRRKQTVWVKKGQLTKEGERVFFGGWDRYRDPHV